MHKIIYRLFHRLFHAKYKNKYRHAKKLFVFDLILLAIALAMMGGSIFFFFWKPGITSLIDLNISLGAERMKSGDYAHLTIDYLNRSKFKLSSTTLSLQLPDGFVVDRQKTLETDFTTASTFPQIKEIMPGAKGQVEIYGWFWAAPNQEEKIIARLSYQPEDETESKKGREQKIAHYIAKLSDSLLQGTITISSSTFIGTELPFTYNLYNNSSMDLSKVRLTHDWPFEIFAKKDSYSVLSGKSLTSVGTLTAPSKAGEYKISIIPKIIINNHAFEQTRTEAKFTAISPIIISSAGFPASIQYAEAGGIIPLKLNWENKSNYKWQNLRMILTANYPQAINWQLTAKNNNLKAEKNRLIIDGQSRTLLNSGSIGSKDEFTVDLYLNPSFSLNQAEKTFLTIAPAMEGELGSISGQKYSQKGGVATIPLATQINLDAHVRYYTAGGDQLGRGPLPPAIGKTTKYWVFIQIDNGSNSIKDVSWQTTLPNGVELTGKQSVTIGAKIEYDKESRAISWKHSDLPANSSTGLYFEIQTAPTPLQVGQKLRLTNDLLLTATDEFVNKKIQIKQAGLDNILRNDDNGRNAGYLVAL